MRNHATQSKPMCTLSQSQCANSVMLRYQQNNSTNAKSLTTKQAKTKDRRNKLNNVVHDPESGASTPAYQHCCQNNFKLTTQSQRSSTCIGSIIHTDLSFPPACCCRCCCSARRLCYSRGGCSSRTRCSRCRSRLCLANGIKACPAVVEVRHRCS